MLIKALLIAIWAGICFLDEFTIWTGANKALIAGFVTGIILGDMKQGLIIAGTLELLWLSNSSVGAYQPPNVTCGAIVGVAIAIISHGGTATGITVGVAVAVVVQQLVTLRLTLYISLIHKADQAALEGDFNKVDKWHLLAIPLTFLTGAIPVFVAVYIGGPAAQKLLSFIPTNIMTGLTVASSIIPAVGMGMLLKMMIKGNMWIFLVLGFTLSAYLHLSTLPLAFIGLTFAVLYDMIIQNKPTLVSSNGNEIKIKASEEEYDL